MRALTRKGHPEAPLGPAFKFVCQCNGPLFYSSESFSPSCTKPKLQLNAHWQFTQLSPLLIRPMASDVKCVAKSPMEERRDLA